VHSWQAMTEMSEQFVHKRIIGGLAGGLSSLITGGNPLAGAAVGFARGGGRERAPEQPSVQLPQLGRSGMQVPELGPDFRDPGAPSGRTEPSRRRSRLVARDDCPWPQRRDERTGQCGIFLGAGKGPEPEPPSSPAMQGGSAPFQETVAVRRCLPGSVLGSDGACYDRRMIRNADRMWPKGRAPLLTGGERNAIAKASRASKKIQRTTKQLQKLGMLPKPGRRAQVPRHGHAVTVKAT